MSTKYIDPMEVSAQVNTFAWLLGHMDSDNAINEDHSLGLLCIGYMISDNVDAMIADYDQQLGIDSLGKKEVPEESA
ncbi:hypothetical protein FACS189483_09030 [Spirochaetia bacterium]|nr:hypothetical protein FACS189483_09030 [Spirochaetia bacterium]